MLQKGVTLSPPKADLSDFGRAKMPNSGKPEFGWERAQVARPRLRRTEDCYELDAVNRPGARRQARLRCARARHRSARARSGRRLLRAPRAAARQAADGRSLHLLRP